MVISSQSVLTGKERKCKKEPSQRGKVDRDNKRLNGRQTDEIWFNLQPILVKCSVHASTRLLSVCDRWTFTGPSRNNLYFNDSSHDCNTHDRESCDIHHQHALKSINSSYCFITPSPKCPVYFSSSVPHHAIYTIHANLTPAFILLCPCSLPPLQPISPWGVFPSVIPPSATLNQVRYCPNQCYLIVRIRQVIIHTSLPVPLADGAW